MSGDQDPVVLAPDEDPIKTLRAMARFMPGPDRGIAPIQDGATVLGWVALSGPSEKVALPICDARSRVAEVVSLSDWLKHRGYEASACRWIESGSGADKWTLGTGPAQVPRLPPPFPGGASAEDFHRRSEAMQQAINRRINPPIFEKDENNV